MANTAISNLPAATTPLVGTETLPIVQGGVTVKTTVADITGAGAYAGSFTTLSSTGNTTLGDATTDTVTVNGYMGVGGAATSTTGVTVASIALTGIGQIGVVSSITTTSAATNNARAYYGKVSTAAAVYTTGNIYVYFVDDVTKGAGSTITNQHGLYIADQTQGTNNYGITSLVSSGTNKWNIYASGTASNYLAGSLGIGTISLTGYNLRIAKTITGAVNSYGVFVDGATQSDVTTSSNIFYTFASTQAAAFTLNSLLHYAAVQTTIGAGSIVTSQYGVFSSSSLTGATNNYGLYSALAAPTSGIATTGTITSISSSTTTVTVNHNAITYTNGQTVTISATANATDLTSGATCTILVVGTTDFTLIGAASNTVGVSFTATGAGTGTGTVTLNVQGSGKTVAGAASGSFTYTTTTSQTFAAVTVLTGSVTVSKRYNLYMTGTADNYLAGNVGIGTTAPVGKLDVAGTSPTLNIRDTQQKTWVAGDIVGTLDFYADDVSGVGAQAVSRIRSLCDAGSAAPSGALAFWTAAAGSAATEKMRIDSSGNVGIGTSSPSASAILDAQSTTKGVRMPNMTTVQKNAVASPAAGLMVFDTTLAKLCVYTGAAWETITSI
jgi:hypothetical protein